jgi:hypothetical protein
MDLSSPQVRAERVDLATGRAATQPQETPKSVQPTRSAWTIGGHREIARSPNMSRVVEALAQKRSAEGDNRRMPALHAYNKLIAIKFSLTD